MEERTQHAQKSHATENVRAPTAARACGSRSAVACCSERIVSRRNHKTIMAYRSISSSRGPPSSSNTRQVRRRALLCFVDELPGFLHRPRARKGRKA